MSQCPTTQGRYNWRYQQDVRGLVHEVERQRKDAKNRNKNQCFYRLWENAKQQRRDMRISLREFLDRSQDWQLDRGLEKKLNFPGVVPNIVKKDQSSCWLVKGKRQNMLSSCQLIAETKAWKHGTFQWRLKAEHVLHSKCECFMHWERSFYWEESLFNNFAISFRLKGFGFFICQWLLIYTKRSYSVHMCLSNILIFFTTDMEIFVTWCIMYSVYHWIGYLR